uniref:Bm8869 n=1 Tax=Brugia malayi TaxID=6279 RepID=A0A0J9Y8Y2_BRUMA|nr:Bm8869 [Brugia malayi]
MILKFIVLTFVTSHAIPTDIISTTEGVDDKTYNETEIQYVNKLLEKVFVCTPVGEAIAQHLANDDLENMALALLINLPVMCEAANFVLNRRSKMLHYRDSKITPSYLVEAFKRISEINCTDDAYRCSAIDYLWSPNHAILFNSEKPINITGIAAFCYILVITPQKDHLKIFRKVVMGNNGSFVPDEIKGSPMNGVIIPWMPSSLDINLKYVSVMKIRSDDSYNSYQSLKSDEDEVKLIILICSDDERTRENAISRALNATEMIREDLGNAPICVVAQSDTRENVRESLGWYRDSSVIVFYGLDISASTLLVDTKDDKILKAKFEDWKEEFFFLDNYQTIAFHFTMVNGNEPENSEEIFSEIFPHIPLSTLRLLNDSSSIVGLNYQIGTEFRFLAGPTYAIVGFRKFG